MVTENPSKTPIFILIIVIIIGILFGLVWYFTRKKPFTTTLTYFFIGLIVLLLIGLIFTAIFWLFKKHRTDMIHINRQRIIEACRLFPPDKPQNLVMRGNTELESRYIGRVTGICRAFTKPAIYKEADKDKKPIVIRPALPITFISFKKAGGILSFLSTENIFVGFGEAEYNLGIKETDKNNKVIWKTKRVKQTADYSHLSGDTIYLMGMTFCPSQYGMYFLDKRYNDTNLIDESVKEMIYRYTLQELLKEEIEIVESAIAISPEHQKQMERSAVQEIKESTAVAKP